MLDNTRKKYGLPNKFVLYVGDVNYNKNILGLAEACNIANIPLVIVGKQATDVRVDLKHKENESFSEFLTKYGEDKNIYRLGFVPDSDLVKIFKLASVYCQPSFYEGFGLPVLEAMASGVPVVASKTQALVEIGDDAAIYVNPKDPKDIAKGITEAVGNPTALKVLGAKRVKLFSWEKAAKETYDYYRELLRDEQD